MKRLLLLFATLLVGRAYTQTVPLSTRDEPFRPQYHFTPAKNWINDPNGLVYHAGEYHLFYQYNPFGSKWGHMTWGHAVSRDLHRWEELLPAIPEDSVMIFSGSCVVDAQNTSGFGQNGVVPMVAIYTGAGKKNQSQYVAYSLDKGRTWTKYARNPVIDLKHPDFRDPSVFWHEPTKRWVMTAVLAPEKKALFFTSSNLKDWTKSGEFIAPDSPATIWECPALVQVPVRGAAIAGKSQKRWVLLLSMGGNAPAGGTGMQYFVGDFDGKRFRSERSGPDVRYVDWGKDYYAAIPFNHAPGGRAITIGWMNNWQYAGDLPTGDFRGAMTLTRELTLAPDTDGRLHLQQQPVPPTLGATLLSLNATSDVALNNRARPFSEDCYVVNATFDARKAHQIALRVGPGEETVVGYDPARRVIYVDRTRSGNVAFHKDFPARTEAPYVANGQTVAVQIWVDRSSVEVFTADGRVTLTNQIFPGPQSRGLRFSGSGFRRVTARRVKKEV